MKALTLLLVFVISGCSAFDRRYVVGKPPIMINETVTIKIVLDGDLNYLGKDVIAASSCTAGGICTLHIPGIKHPNDSQGFCMWGFMLGRAVFGKRRDETGLECSDY